MKRKLRFLAGACLFTATALFSGCSSDDDFLMDPVDSGTSQTRAVTNPDGTLKCTPNIGRISICLDGMSSVLYRAHVV